MLPAEVWDAADAGYLWEDFSINSIRVPDGSLSRATEAPSSGAACGEESSFTPLYTSFFAKFSRSFTSKLM